MTPTRTARLLAEAAQRHDQAKTIGERQAASKAINDLILDVERMVELARAYLGAFEQAARVCEGLIPNYEPEGWSHAALESAAWHIRALGQKQPLQGKEDGG